MDYCSESQFSFISSIFLMVFGVLAVINFI